VYVGEAVGLSRRFRHYRTPGAGLTTNGRLQTELLLTLYGGGRVVVEVVAEAYMTDQDCQEHPLDLSRKSARHLVEAAAEVAERRNPLVRVINDGP